MKPRFGLRQVDGGTIQSPYIEHYQDCTVWETEECNCADIDKDFEYDRADQKNDEAKGG